VKDANVGCLVEGPRPLDAKAIQVYSPNRFAEGEHSIEEVQLKAQNLAGVGVGAMMCVMKESAEAEAPLARKNLMYYIRLIPFMNDHQVGTREFAVEKGR
jgi:hypothetical protein